MNKDTISGSENDIITISIDSVNTVDWKWNDNMSSTGVIAQEISSIDLGGGITTTQYVTADTITLSGIDDLYTSPTKADHNELMDRVAQLEKLIAEEAEIRSKNPAVKNAYDEYRLLLVLAKQHTNGPLTEE
jgi:hypothetical protein